MTTKSEISSQGVFRDTDSDSPPLIPRTGECAESAERRLDIKANRAEGKYVLREIFARILWASCRPLFRFSPRPCFAWRSWLLRRFGAHVGRWVHIYNTAVVYFPWNLEIDDYSAIGEQALIYNLGRVSIGAHVTISQRAHICAGTHDYTRPNMLLLKPPIHLQSQVWICADAFVGPNTVVGEGAVVGARAVVMKDVAAWTVVAGNPAKVIRTREIRHD